MEPLIYFRIQKLKGIVDSAWYYLCSTLWSSFVRHNGNLCLQVRLHEENERCLLCLDESTRKPVIAAAERQLLECHISAIIDKVRLLISFLIGGDYWSVAWLWV